MSGVICTHFLQGRCKFGDQCAKKHLAHSEAKLRAHQISSGWAAVHPGQQAGDPPPGGWADGGGQAPPQAAPSTGRPRGFFEFVGKRLRGVVKSFSPLTGYGFINCPETFEVFGRDIYALSDQIGQIPAGNEVSFEVFMNRGGQPEAKNVRDDKVCHGYLKSFHPGNGYGFIACNETFAIYARDVFVHKDQVGQYPCGQEVSFTVSLNDRKQPQAHNVAAESNGTSQASAVSAAPSHTQSGNAGNDAYDPFAPAAASEAYNPSAAGNGSHGRPADLKPEGRSLDGADAYDPFADAGGPDPHAGTSAYDPFAQTGGSDVYDPFADPPESNGAKSKLNPEELGKLSVKELKGLLADAGQALPSGLTEKADLVALVAALP